MGENCGTDKDIFNTSSGQLDNLTVHRQQNFSTNNDDVCVGLGGGL